MLSRRALLGSLAATAASAADPRPNTLFILIDDLRFNALGCLGHLWIETPNIDRLAKEGAILSNAFVTIPLCSPSRACFLTGRWAHAHGIIDNTNRSEASHKLVTYPMHQQKAGYETAYIGKWHMGNDDSPRPGFDHWVSFPGQGQYFDPPINVNGQAEKKSGLITDILNEHAVTFLKRPRTKPFSLYLAHKAVHGPFTPPERHKDLYAGKPIPRHPNVNDDRSGKPILTRAVETNKKNPTAGQGPNDETVRNQMRLLKAVDEGLGEILKTLAETRQLDRTLIIFTSDNGYFHGDHGLGDKRAAYEESLRIPMLVRYPPWIKAGTRIPAMVLSNDLAPTMLEVAGLKPTPEMKGKSLVPLLRGKTKSLRADFYAEYHAEAQFPRIPTWRAVRSERWKYIDYPENAAWNELYDLERDPYEMKNLIADAKAPLAQLKARLEALSRETG